MISMGQHRRDDISLFVGRHLHGTTSLVPVAPADYHEVFDSSGFPPGFCSRVRPGGESPGGFGGSPQGQKKIKF